MSILKEFIYLNDTGPTLKIAVIGDAMLDQYFSTKIKRISPEFPIPICLSEDDKSEDFPGGAANVAYSFKHFNVYPKLISFVDPQATVCFLQHNIDVSLCCEINGNIPRKRRFYSNDFPTYRWDIEKHNYGLKNIEYERCRLQKVNPEEFDAIIFSDYNKGVFSESINQLVRKARISVVDPKSSYLEWIGCTVFKPNKQEALNLSGKNTVQEAGIYLQQKLECQAVVVTEGEDGVSVFTEVNQYEIRPNKTLPIAESTIGAGDTYISFLTMALARGIHIKDAAEIAFQAGVSYVKNRHNKPITKNDLVPNKFVLPEIERDYKLAFTNGCFDVLHCGHLESLKFAKSKADKLVVAVNSDESVGRLKPGRPINSLKDRMNLLAGLECVDFVISFEEDTPLELIKKIKPEILVKGSEFQVENIVGKEFAGEVIRFPMIEGLSTTKIIEKLSTSDSSS